MAKIQYIYDTEKCKYERIETTRKDLFLRLSGFVGLSVCFATIIFFVGSSYFPSPNELVLRSENDEFKYDFETTKKELQSYCNFLDHLQKRDNEIYRVITETSRPNMELEGFDTTSFLSLNEEDYSRFNRIRDNVRLLAQLSDLISSQNNSYDDLILVSKEKETLLSSIPAIQPVSNKQLRRLASGFGYRRDPGNGTRKFHKGIDFSAPRGTPIYATGDGKIKIVKSSNRGYGRQVIIDHGFGYMTRYGHMHTIMVEIGQEVKRGEQIGTVGNTGRSFGPHVHYEVFKDKKVVNPIYYFFRDLNGEEYEEILRLASLENKPLS